MRTQIFKLLALCLVVGFSINLSTAQVANKYGHLQVVGTQLCDQNDTPIQLKGMSSFWLNWDNSEGIGYANYDAIKWLRDNWNMQVFRAAMGVEPNGGYLDNPDEMKAKMHHIVQSCIDLGIYVIIDYHAHDAHENPGHAKEFFGEMASTYGSYPNVLYEPFNEPTDQSWSDVLKPYHKSILDTIRTHSPKGIVLFGVRNWSQDVEAAALDPVVDPEEDPQTMLVLHFYAGTHTQSYRNKANLAMERGQAIFVTEWGASAADGGQDMSIFEDESETWLEWMKENKISWAAWNLHDKEESCAILAGGAPVDGGWDDDSYFKGHAFLVRDAMLQDPESCLFHTNPVEVELDCYENEVPIDIHSTTNWSASIESEWITATNLSGSSNDTIWLSIPENELDTVRTAELTVTFTCPDEDEPYSMTVTISQDPFYNVDSVKLDRTDLILSLEDSLQLAATVYPDNATEKDLTWHSLNDTIVTVTQNGLIHAIGVGTTSIVVTSNDGEHTDTAHIEVQVCSYTLDLATWATATASSREGSQYEANNAIDGNPNSRWSSAATDDEWMTIDLGNTYYIDRVKLIWEAAYGSDYRIDISPDNENWYMAHRTTGGNGGTEDLTSIGGLGQYLRMHGVKRGSNWGYSLWTFEVYGCLTIEEGKSYLMAGPSDYTVQPNAYSGTIEVISNLEWSASTESSWLSIESTAGADDGSIPFQADENTAYDPRTAEISITSNDIERNVYIHQEGLTPEETTTITSPSMHLESMKLYPVPASTHIDAIFSINEPSKVQFEVINTLGQKVQSLQPTLLNAGEHTQRINLTTADNTNLGVHILRVTIENSQGISVSPHRFVIGSY